MEFHPGAETLPQAEPNPPQAAAVGFNLPHGSSLRAAFQVRCGKMNKLKGSHRRKKKNNKTTPPKKKPNPTTPTASPESPVLSRAGSAPGPSPRWSAAW